MCSFCAWPGGIIWQQVNRLYTRPVVYTLYRKPFNDNIYKQWEFVGVMVIRVVIDFQELIKMALKRGSLKGVGGWRKRNGDC
jgi:hypothetical protein